MGFLDNVANKAVPEGSGLAKPLILAFTALLASGVLGRKQEPTPAPGTSPASHPDAGGLLGGLVDCSKSFSRAVMATWQNHGSAPVKINRSLLVHSVRLSVPRLLSLCLKRRVCPNSK